jgi:hypothetical protein
MANGGAWHANDVGARLECGPLVGSVSLDESSACFLVERWQSRALYGTNVLSYFGPQAGTSGLGMAETYVRGNDFVATYVEGSKQRVTPQLYWRAECLDEFHAARLELIVSVKTDLLDSRPLSRTHSLLSADGTFFHTASLASPRFETLQSPRERVTKKGGRAIHIDASASPEHLFVFRMPDVGLSFAQVVHPTDYVAADVGIDSEPPYSLVMTLFPERLEKGVIRRGRVCGFFLPIKNDLEVGVELAKRFVNEPLPLTT